MQTATFFPHSCFSTSDNKPNFVPGQTSLDLRFCSLKKCRMLVKLPISNFQQTMHDNHPVSTKKLTQRPQTFRGPTKTLKKKHIKTYKLGRILPKLIHFRQQKINSTTMREQKNKSSEFVKLQTFDENFNAWINETKTSKPDDFKNPILCLLFPYEIL